MTSHVYDTGITTAMNAFGALLNSGFLKVYTGAQPAVDAALTGIQLASLSLSATAFAAAAASGTGGSMTANSITAATASNTGTAGYFALIKSDNTTVVATGACATSSAELNFNTTSISSGDTISVSSFSVTQAQP
jgi:hypothetical protein